MNIRFMETVIALAQFRNFRATAEHMNITPAAISSRILAIENELGIRLFDRDSKDVRITTEGEIFLASALRIVGEYKELARSLSNDEDAHGTVRLGVLPSVAPAQLLPRIIRHLESDHPHLSLVVMTDSGQRLTEMLDAGELDVVLGINTTDHPGRQTVPLWTLGMYWVARSGTFPDGANLTPEDLFGQPIISYAPGTLNYQRLVKYLGSVPTEEFTLHYSNALGTTIHLVEAGVGISVIPPIVVQDQLRSGRLTVLDVNPKFPATPYHAIWLQNAPTQMPRLIAEIARKAAFEIAGEFSRDLVSIPTL